MKLRSLHILSIPHGPCSLRPSAPARAGCLHPGGLPTGGARPAQHRGARQFAASSGIIVSCSHPPGHCKAVQLVKYVTYFCGHLDKSDGERPGSEQQAHEPHARWPGQVLAVMRQQCWMYILRCWAHLHEVGVQKRWSVLIPRHAHIAHWQRHTKGRYSVPLLCVRSVVLFPLAGWRTCLVRCKNFEYAACVGFLQWAGSSRGPGYAGPGPCGWPQPFFLSVHIPDSAAVG